MEKRTVGIIATVATVLLCGCPGLFGLCFGAISALAGFTPGSEIDLFGSSDPQSAIYTGIALLCVGLIGIVIPILVAYFTLIRKRNEMAGVSQTPIPPAY